MSDGPQDLRQLDTSRARKGVVLTRTADTGGTPDVKGAGGGRPGTVLGAGLTLTSILSVTLGLMFGWIAAVVALALGVVATVVATARATSPAQLTADPSGTRLQRLERRLAQADLPDAAVQELRGALGDLAAARERELAAEQSVASTLKTLDGPALERALAKAEDAGDPEATAFRQQAVDAWRELVGRQVALKRGYARTEAALDALDVTLAQATTVAAPDSSTLEADSQRLFSQVDALRRATDELDALENAQQPPSRSPERA